jgi:hypothetical protein
VAMMVESICSMKSAAAMVSGRIRELKDIVGIP